MREEQLGLWLPKRAGVFSPEQRVGSAEARRARGFVWRSPYKADMTGVKLEQGLTRSDPKCHSPDVAAWHGAWPRVWCVHLHRTRALD